MVRLFLENNELEITQDISVAITKQFEELTNPTSIINDWSKTVSIPFTVKNNQIFGYIFKEDRMIIGGTSGDSVGLYFDPLKKLDMRIEWSGAILMMGYAKLNEIKQVNGKGTYEITLFGQLGKLFQDMKKITFDNSTTETDYLINGSTWVDEKINRTLVYNSWTTASQSQSTLQNKYINSITPGGQIRQLPNPYYKVTDIIGFAPNNSFSEDFKYDTYQSEYNASDTFVNDLGDSFTEATGVQPDTLIKDGVMPREIGEYRSYLQLPFIYWNKLFQVFQNKAQSVTGYTFDLDSDWFSTSNPYWYNLVYMLNPLPFSNKGAVYNNTYTNKFGNNGIIGNVWQTNNNTLTSTVWQTEKSIDTFAVVESSSVETFAICDFDYPISNWTIPENSIVAFTLPFTSMVGDSNGRSDNPYLNPNNALLISVIMTGANGTSETQKFLIKRSTSSVSETGAIIISNDTHITANVQDYITTQVVAYFIADRDTYGNSVSFNIKQQWKTTSNPSTSNTTLNGNKVITASISAATGKLPQVNILKNSFHSGSSFTLNDLWNNDYNLFGEILKYCKMYRIGISVDNIAKKIIFKPLKKYFTTYTVEDWSDKIDKSKDYTITPVTFEDKYILFNYKDIDTKLAKDYKEKYGVNYGDYRLITDYNFNSNTKNLFDGITPSMVNTDNVLSWKNLKTNHKVIYSFPAELYVYNKDKDNKQVSTFGAFYFHKGLQSFDTETALQLLPVKISDDTEFQLANNTYFYNRSEGNRLLVYTYPLLDIVNGDNLCVFNTPSENYTYLNNYSGKNSIYYNFWDKYIDERYNIQNKKITCYVMLSPIDYNQFAWNKLVKVGNQLCIVNKIYDYDITAKTPTKVDLITIQDISAYNTTNY